MNTATPAPAVPAWVEDRESAAATLFGHGSAHVVTDYRGDVVAEVTPVWCDGDEAVSVDLERPLNVAEARELAERLAAAVDTITAHHR